MNRTLISILLLVAVLIATTFGLSDVAQAETMATSVKLRISAATMDLNGKAQGRLGYTVVPAGANEQLRWLSSNRNVVTVSDSGVVTAVGVGTAIVGVRGASTSWSKCTITVRNTGSSGGGSTGGGSTGGGSTGGGDITAPATIRLHSSSAKMDLNGKNVGRLSYTVTPANSSLAITWVTTNASVATVSSNGTITAVGVGSTVIGARIGSSGWSKCKITVVNSARPTSLSLASATLTVAPGATSSVAVSVLPAAADQRLLWKSANSSIASVTSAGVVTGVKSGKTYLRVYSAANPRLYKQIVVNVSANAPTSITVPQTIYTVAQGSSFQINATAQPATASQQFKWVSSNSAVASVTQEGTVLPVRTGKAIIRIYSAEDPNVYVAVGIKVTGTSPASIYFSTREFYLSAGDTLQLTPTLQPAGCKDAVTWKTSSTSVATVGESGVVTAVSAGTATITCTPVYASNISATVTITVLDTERTTVVPARYTSLSGLKANLAKIDAIRISAFNVLTNGMRTGALSSSEALSRKAIVNRAIAMYRFPWMTTIEQPYWRASSSLNGLKDFQVGRVYYGLPYIQCGKSGDYLSRRFSDVNAVAAGYYTDTGMGYYLMNRDKKYDGMYVGSDCSSFASMSIWGMNSGHSYDYTSIMINSTAYRTLPATAVMQPGDLLIRSGHCVLFLYYTNDARTQMMIIEQGGGNSSDIHNTVCCSVVNVSSYLNGGYILRRLASLVN